MSTAGVVVDAEFKALCPPLSADERAGLESQIIADGCRDALVVWAGHGILLDGHNRYEICERLGIDYSIVEVECADRDAAKVWMIRHQLGRRNITLAARCELAEVLAEAFAAQAKVNQRVAGGDKKSAAASQKSLSSILTTAIGDARKLAAKEANVSTGTLSAYKADRESRREERRQTDAPRAIVGQAARRATA